MQINNLKLYIFSGLLKLKTLKNTMVERMYNNANSQAWLEWSTILENDATFSYLYTFL
jgi:hypothetical protein